MRTPLKKDAIGILSLNTWNLLGGTNSLMYGFWFLRCFFRDHKSFEYSNILPLSCEQLPDSAICAIQMWICFSDQVAIHPSPRMPVTTRIITFLVGNLYKPLFVTGILGGGVDLSEIQYSLTWDIDLDVT